MNDRKILLTSLKIVGIVIVALASVYLLVELRNILVCVIFSLTLAAAIAPVAEWGEQRKVSRITMILLVYLFVGLIYSVVAFSLFPAAKAQWNHLYEHLPNYLTGLTDWVESVKGGIAGESGQVIRVEELVRNVAIKLGHQTLDVGAGLLVLLLDGLLVLFLTAYFVVEATAIWAKLLMWLPHEHRAKAASLIRPLGFRMGGYVRGQLLVSVAVAFYLTAGLTLLKVNYALILGVLAGLLNLVPFVGSLIACIFAIVVAANQSIWLAGATLVLFACEQWCESNFFVPYLLGRNVELHPLIVLIAILIGATLMGVPGALIAVPLASAAQFLAQEFYLKPLNNGRTEPLIIGGKPAASEDTAELQPVKVERAPVTFSPSVDGSSDSIAPIAPAGKPVVDLEDMTPVSGSTSKEREANT
jgi:predicted PurR-regulated permease PerM